MHQSKQCMHTYTLSLYILTVVVEFVVQVRGHTKSEQLCQDQLLGALCLNWKQWFRSDSAVDSVRASLQALDTCFRKVTGCSREIMHLTLAILTTHTMATSKFIVINITRKVIFVLCLLLRSELVESYV